jgi:hypothetical protein
LNKKTGVIEDSFKGDGWFILGTLEFLLVFFFRSDDTQPLGCLPSFAFTAPLWDGHCGRASLKARGIQTWSMLGGTLTMIWGVLNVLTIT